MSAGMLPYGKQSISQEDIDAVLGVLRSEFLTQGPEIELFEKAVSARCGDAHAVAVSSATAALHIACLAADLGPGDTLWTTPNTFVATSNCALYCGAGVDFVDIEPDTGNMDAALLAEKLADARRNGKLPKMVAPVQFAGQPCDMQAIHSLSREYGFIVLEDASHALGATLDGVPVGSCRHSDMAVFSFHPVKIATTGEGGMVLTRDPAIRDRLALLRSHGITRDSSRMERVPPGPWYYEQRMLGFNYRMTDISAALGRSQLGRLDQLVARRRELARRYDDLLRGLPLAPLVERPGRRSAYHLYVVRLDPERAAVDQARVMAAMRAAGIGVNLHYIPVHTQPYYRDLGFKPGDYPKAERYAAEAITLPLYFGLTDEEQDRVVAALRATLA